jgi:hypothetical protein
VVRAARCDCSIQSLSHHHHDGMATLSESGLLGSVRVQQPMGLVIIDDDDAVRLPDGSSVPASAALRNDDDGSGSGGTLAMGTRCHNNTVNVLRT